MQALEDENAVLVGIAVLTDGQKKRNPSKAGSTLLPLEDSLLTPKVVKSTTTDDHATEQQNHNTDTTTDNRQVQERCMRCNELAYGFMVFPPFTLEMHRSHAANATAPTTSPA